MNQIIIQLENGSYKGYNRKAFLKRLEIEKQERDKEIKFKVIDTFKFLGVRRLK